ncbi:hypothetical protein GCM10027598_58750 [Amycolatopsis oliviviridis]|uniref:Uncharacterized protein n=1 Tax=Amycolatopsis oliviviridis TaxID=1471590 RepID=A0ABQ3LXV9_9PSEU|nr:hypothetical protein [Amycolatopsis oliviviridis]GHH28483.1 hypothetical protein GCM10017790_59400 [Amycolatopsis oliviviridis]
MRPNVLAIFSVAALAAAAALAIQQSPNFSSQTTGLSLLTVDTPDYRFIVVPLPYREEQRIIRAPVPATEIATAWATPEKDPMAPPETSASPPDPPKATGESAPPSPTPTSSSRRSDPEHTGAAAGHTPEGR